MMQLENTLLDSIIPLSREDLLANPQAYIFILTRGDAPSPSPHSIRLKINYLEDGLVVANIETLTKLTKPSKIFVIGLTVEDGEKEKEELR